MGGIVTPNHQKLLLLKAVWIPCNQGFGGGAFCLSFCAEDRTDGRSGLSLILLGTQAQNLCKSAATKGSDPEETRVVVGAGEPTLLERVVQ